MTSTLGCIGFDSAGRAELLTTVGRLAHSARPLGTADGVEVLRWEDPSGARLTFDRLRDRLVAFVPSFAGRPGVLLRNCRTVGTKVVVGDVLDSAGAQMTVMGFELEQRRALATDEQWSGTAAVTGFARTAEFFDDRTAYSRSPYSLLDPATADDEVAPEHQLDTVRKRTERMAAESFIPWGLFGDGTDPSAEARLNGTVVEATLRRNTVTGTRFLSARVTCMGFEIDLVAAWDRDEPPTPGSIVAAELFLIASIDSLTFEGAA
ncbi:hypothetical protein B5808_00515 [Cnuibacter physcomitrellae]|uniref:Uncharacterized protein n=1 Tax=Cnuibacter physcomitrellae TaxID=1619308 RepID=A0A1X9LFB2_9MICO|nr:hypothetical protein [Cnuibacter physcomitrellae]ARJ03884.1 hypothetical protein B5808_00515 [Cnuibacter physcomitrellae]